MRVAVELHRIGSESEEVPLINGPWSVSMMVMKIPTWLAVASGLTLMGEDGVTDSTGESSRPLETWFEKGPNCRIESGTGATTNSTAIVGSPLPAKKAGIPGRPLLPILAMVTAFDLLPSDVP